MHISFSKRVTVICLRNTVVSQVQPLIGCLSSSLVALSVWSWTMQLHSFYIRGIAGDRTRSPVCSSCIEMTYLTVSLLVSAYLQTTICSTAEKVQLMTNLNYRMTQPDWRNWHLLGSWNSTRGSTLFSKYCSRTPLAKFYSFRGVILCQSTKANYLGVSLRCDIGWAKHIQQVTSSSRTIGLLH